MRLVVGPEGLRMAAGKLAVLLAVLRATAGAATPEEWAERARKVPGVVSVEVMQ